MVSQEKLLVAAAIEKFLLQESESSDYSSEQVESLQVALQCIQHVFGLESNPVSNAPNLLALVKGQGSQKGAAGDLEKAEQLKTLGNEHLTANRCDEAIKAYTEAIAIDPKNAIFYSNRAAAYMKVSDNEAAVEDCKEAIKLDPQFSKAYRRLGAAYTAMKSNDLAIEAYKKCLQIDSSDASAKSSLESLLKSPNSPSPSSGSAGGPRESPFGAGGMPDLGAMLNNPELMKMAQQMMNSGALNNMMKDPNMMNMMKNMMAGGAGAPSADIEEEE